MSSTDLKFFTNEPERDLYSRFATILRSNTQFFDVLVGYFRTSGFFKMYESLALTDKVRILIGLNVDKFTVKIIDRAKDSVNVVAVSTKDGKEAIQSEIEHEFEVSDASERIEQGVRVFIDWLKSGKMELRLYTEAPIHAKVYIMRKNPELVPDTFGSVITGSSNFSAAGLSNNLEFNVELKDRGDVEFALEKFEMLWEKSIDIRDAYIETINTRTWLKDDITPYELYLKTLYEFFKEEINADKENYDTLLPPGYMRLQYQLDAVIQAKQKLHAYNGVFISDVVGLGKTYICAMLANTFSRNAYKLFICPPVLVDYWRGVLQEFDVARCDVESLGKLDNVINKGADKYAYVFVDEAHRFRNSGTDSFTKLHEICRNKKVILISATPINNYTADIENQLCLFQSKHNGTINGVKNIEGFFAGLNSKLKKYPKGTPGYMQQLRENAEVIRDRLLREVMVRRTRNEIKEFYKEDLEKQGLTFPIAGSPEKLLYTFDEDTDEAFNTTMAIIRDFTYSRYTPLLYLKDTKKYAKALVAQRNMGGFMKGILVKRLESSFYAFRMTLERFIESYEKFIEMYNSGMVYISKKVDVYDLLDDGNVEKLAYLVEKDDVWEFSSKEFKATFIRDLRHDLGELKSLRDIWAGIDCDPKLAEFKVQLTTNPIMKGKKVIVFTESKETAQYLRDNLEDIYVDRLVNYCGQSTQALKAEIEDSFNPKFIDKGNDKYDLLITTDVLAEGVNLHLANVLVNYDLPWNPTRIMQRVGRINRVGSAYDRIYVFNCFPTAQSNAQLPLEDRILEKMQAFHDTLGEDIQYLSDAEIVSSKRLFDDLNKNIDDEDGGTNPELAYLAIIRDIRDNNPSLFTKIKRLPKKARTGKQCDMVDNVSTITFIRKGALKSFFKTTDNTTEYLPFMEAIPYIKADKTEKQVPLTSKYYEHFKANDTAFDSMLTAEEEVRTDKVVLRGNDAKIVKRLKFLRAEPALTDDQEAKIDKMLALWSDGEIPSKVSKDVMKACNSIVDSLELYYEILKIIPESYFAEKQISASVVDGEKQIILSCHLIPGGNNR